MYNPQKLNKLKAVAFICLSLLATDAISADGARTYIAGNKAHADIYDRDGPNGDGSRTLKYSLSGNQTLVFYKSATLQPSNVGLNLNSDTANTGTGMIYCTKINGATGADLVVENNFVDSGLTYGGHKLLKTNITGLYFTFRIHNPGSWEILFAPSELYVGDQPTQTMKLTQAESNCANDGYKPIGGITGTAYIDFYNDASFDPRSSESVSLLSNGSYSYRFYNPNPGPNILSYYINVIASTDNVKISQPTCSTAVLSGDTVKGTTVSIGSYSPNDIINGVNPVPFNIELSGCSRVRNIAVKLTAGTTGTDPTLLGNTQISGKADGVGLQIKALKNSVSDEMVLIPNDDTSVYKDYEDETDTSTTGIAGNGGSIATTTQSLKFNATLKRDNNQKILSGKFYATGIFSITYP
ncbi:fimbrial protein [Salmonella enterica subsp. indica]|uniref:Fimbrial protein n=1 Tax=Salmonella enterica TaxID=28901 RepID=A0A701YT84_SALER|nr:fimbrial protein [Salmonella enterica]EAW1719933.1 fimbrial protein [Salmonella enterica subsp. indica]HCM1933429.1 fimbrial protein [Salmonella enterica subsp. indica serovar 6,7:z41:1,7]ECG1334924.1 fimbrial protein [Salmonella enterica subsp. indica]MBA3215530.1 fimbrial protein [Salmonella enterica]HAC6563712.1 fimbrial protein [Salmonella enterica subsp. indica]